jgi:hypothetical protein
MKAGQAGPGWMAAVAKAWSLARGMAPRSLERSRLGSPRTAQDVRSRAALGDQFLRELRELRDDGDISAELAARIFDDFFEPVAAGERPQLKLSVWRACAEEDRKARVIAHLRSGGRWADDDGSRN